MSSLKQTPLHQRHLAAKARMVPFAGYEMPVQYAGVIPEHRAVRSGVGVFDVSHMGEVEFRGSKAIEVVDRIVTNHVGRLQNGQACYTCMCKEDGGIIDDLVVYRIADDHVLICVNASNRTKDFEWMRTLSGDQCDVEDTSDQWVQIAVQGPKAAETIQKLSATALDGIGTYRFSKGDIAGTQGILARTGYTGEDGFELYVPSQDGPKVWDAVFEANPEAAPAGLGARDSLRLEMCFPLYGNDLDESVHPFEAGLGWVVKLKKSEDFSGKSALQTIKEQGNKRKLVPLFITGRGIARAGYKVLDRSGSEIGVVTSGTQSPSLERPIALAFVKIQSAQEGTELAVEIRGKPVTAEITRRPFLQRG